MHGGAPTIVANDSGVDQYDEYLRVVKLMGIECLEFFCQNGVEYFKCRPLMIT